MGVAEKRKFTPQEYLDAERKASFKSEYYKGEVFAMSGASRNHNVINLNFLSYLHNLLKDKTCRPYGNDMRLHIPVNTLYTYPDIMVVCGEEQFLDSEFDTLLNPVFIGEVLSPSTADYDTGGKFTLYRSIPSLQEYWTLSSFECRLEKFIKNSADNTWILSETTHVDDIVELSCLDIKVPLAEVYAGVKF